ncbi:hypothetical protein [Streptococcus suis]|uniref:hypothetical protein n=1 Tax=Streptococcus suis TaxID=1307 RepID=UPI00211C5584|nr:hypothetical protein [Streptococcus suis]MCQ9225808.1 hypothetical protein [Streptococcus suis]MCQ9228081.1 hypothetical protein [Streptococcus suis]MCQ9242139.1 hypothetical protein [Streptococcus suis]MCQ9274372.1 hypothetical protein [Streptococcus suis]MDE7534824.1 hypothetical protein [Streptococcus suis]
MSVFDLNEVISDLVSLDQQQSFEQKIEIFLLVVKKKENEIYKQESDNRTKRVLFESLKSELEKSRFKNREVMAYDAVFSKKNTHELVNVGDYENIAIKLEEFNDENKYLTSTHGMNEKKFHMYMISLKTDNHNYKVFGNFSNVLELKKKFIFGNFSDSRIEFSDSNNIVGFSKKIELLVVDDKYILINQAEAKFESVFKMNALFSGQATKILEDNEKIKSIFSDTTRNKLIDKVKSGKRMATRLIKITSDIDRFNKTVDNIKKIEEIIKDDTHTFYDKVKDVVYFEGQLTVPDGKEVQLLNAISDAFYHAIFSETDNVDESRM